MTSLHQLQSAHLSPSVMKRPLFKKKFTKSETFVGSVVHFGQPSCPGAAKMFHKVLLHTKFICVRYVTETVLKYQVQPCDSSVLNI